MKLADYAYKIHENYLFIKDLNLGKISLTNSIEHVLKKINQKEDVQKYTIVEIDSEEEISEVLWDGNNNVSWCAFESKREAEIKSVINKIF